MCSNISSQYHAYSPLYHGCQFTTLWSPYFIGKPQNACPLQGSYFIFLFIATLPYRFHLTCMSISMFFLVTFLPTSLPDCSLQIASIHKTCCCKLLHSTPLQQNFQNIGVPFHLLRLITHSCIYFLTSFGQHIYWYWHIQNGKYKNQKGQGNRAWMESFLYPLIGYWIIFQATSLKE